MRDGITRLTHESRTRAYSADGNAHDFPLASEFTNEKLSKVAESSGVIAFCTMLPHNVMRCETVALIQLQNVRQY